MEYREAPAPASLSPIVRCLWMLRGDAGSDGAGAQDVFPDGRGEIVLNLADPFLHHGAEGAAIQPLAMVVGITTGPMRIGPTGRIDVVGIRFQPHGLAAALRVPGGSLVNRSFPLEDLSVRLLDIGRLRERSAWPDRVRELERMLLHAFSGRKADPLAAAATEIIERYGGRVSVEGLSGRLGVGPRTLERRFHEEVGIAPKSLCRIFRLHQAIGKLQSGTCGLAATAAAAGYHDQSHLTREFRDLTGTTPAAFLANADPLTRTFVGFDDP